MDESVDEEAHDSTEAPASTTAIQTEGGKERAKFCLKKMPNNFKVLFSLPH
jgi:hypothetical protein